MGKDVSPSLWEADKQAYSKKVISLTLLTTKTGVKLSSH